jgi:uncharacterized membrane protein HdeD (DUF308 family)
MWEEDMIRVLINNWWLLALRGFFALLFATLVFSLQPLAESFFTAPIVHVGLVVVFALLALAAGVSTIAAALYHAGKDRSHLLLWDGIAVSVAGLVILLAPKLEVAWLVLIVAVWAILVGILELLMAHTLRRHIPDEWSLSLAGLGSLMLGAYFLFDRSDGTISLLRWLGVYAAFSAVTILALAFRLHGFRSSIHKVVEGAEVSAPK